MKPQALLSKFALQPTRLSPRSKTWGREAVATVGKDGARVYLNKLVHEAREDTLEAAEEAAQCHPEAAGCHH